MHPGGHVGEGVREDEGALEDLLRLDPMGDVHDLDARGDALDDAPARPDEVVLEAEVR
jgi:hypothetical protein